VASGDQLLGRGGLIGRVTELRLLEAFLSRAASEGEALLVVGEAGVGKTALLDRASSAALAAEARVLRARGIEFEAEMSFSGLNQSLIPLLDFFPLLPRALGEALDVALGLGEGPPPDRLVVSNATLAVLRLAAAEQPLLLVVDDVTWLDRASAGVLGFVARRLVGSHVGLLASARPEEESFFESAGLPELQIGPLDLESAAALLDQHSPELAHTVRARILVEARGNPLALLEFSEGLSEGQRIGRIELPITLPLGRRLQVLFTDRIEQLPDGARWALLLMALDGAAEFHPFAQQGLASRLPDLSVAERARLVRVDGATGRPVFRHPLIASAVVELSTSEERQRAHAELAEIWTDDPVRHARHLAACAVAPDEAVAALLDELGRTIARRGDGVGAVSAFIRAAELSPEQADRARRLAAAAFVGADLGGEMARASELLADAGRADPRFAESLQAAATAAFVLINEDGNVEIAHRLLVGAMQVRQEDSGLEEALQTLALICFFGGRPELWKPFDAALESLGREVSTTLYLVGTCFADPSRRALAALPRLTQAIAELAIEVDPTVVLKVGFAAGNADRLSDCRQAFLRVARGARDVGSLGAAIQALVLLAFDDLHTGEWDEALELAAEATELCEMHGFPLFVFSVQHLQAVIAAARGDGEYTDALLKSMTAWAAPRGVGLMRQVAAHVGALAAASRGDFEAAYQSSVAVIPSGTFPSHTLMANWLVFDLVEAAVRTGRQAEAESIIARLCELNLAAVSARMALLVTGAAALVAPDEQAMDLFDEALATPGSASFAFSRARDELAYGERLRRSRRPSDSRVHLQRALDAFERLRATPWLERTAHELQASGATRVRAAAYERDRLTTQELAVAQLAASGLTNKEIGERLFLSPRTVGGHLHRAFRKLGIATRAALRDALARLPVETDEHRKPPVSPPPREDLTV
jgi:DNA-binding CsgD family transcriptional regulator